MRVLILDGHPDNGRLVSHLLDTYQESFWTCNGFVPVT
jgi:hypothetical protein